MFLPTIMSSQAEATLPAQILIFNTSCSGVEQATQLSPLVPTDRDHLRIARGGPVLDMRWSLSIRAGRQSRNWIVDLSSNFPTATFDTFDVTTNFTHRTEWLPSNVNFRHVNVFKPVSEEFTQKYNIVHIRFFSPVVSRTGPGPVLKTLLQMLSE